MDNKKPVIIKSSYKKISSKTSRPCGLHCIKIKDIGVRVGDLTILENINLHIHCGKLTAIIGKNGAGKSTLLKAILGEIDHTGIIEFKDMRNNEFSDLKIGYVPQHLNIEKNSPTSVYDIFASFHGKMPVFIHKQKSLYYKIKKQLSKFMAEELIDRAVCDLSGGELQRVLLSIATLPIPNLLILDEPISGVDQNGMDLFYKNIEKLKNNYDLSIIVVSHDLNFVAKYADNVILLDKTIVCEGNVSKVYKSREFVNTFGNHNYITT